MTLLDPVRKKQTSLAAPDALQLMLQIRSIQQRPRPARLAFGREAQIRPLHLSTEKQEGNSAPPSLAAQIGCHGYNALAFKPPPLRGSQPLSLFCPS